MASVPYEKAVGELCSECRPVSLGLQPHLRSFEVLVKGKEGGDGEGEEEGERDWGVEGEKIKKDLKALEEAFRGLDIIDTIDAGNTAKDKRRKDGVEKSTEEEQPTEQAPAAEKAEPPVKETTAATPAPIPAAETSDTTTKPSFLSSFMKIFSSSPSSPSPSPSPSPTPPPTTTTASPQPSNTDPEPWISVPQDPDWETVTSEEKKEVDRKLWKDKGEWIKVNSMQEKLE
jgi:hypothetical protein